MVSSNLHEIKRERKRSLFFREITKIINLIAEEEDIVAKIYVTRVDFAADFSVCYVYMTMHQDFSEDIFNKAVEVLKSYTSSIRKELARRLNPRYTPDIIFLHDKLQEKKHRIDALLDKVRKDLD